jgi:hypothetical protein
MSARLAHRDSAFMSDPRRGAPMRGLGLKDGLVAALKADAISLAAFAVGFFGWMALVHFLLLPGATIARWTYWFMMQIGVAVGFVTRYPANGLLIRWSIKEAM